MEEISLREIQEKYSWLTDSVLYKEEHKDQEKLSEEEYEDLINQKASYQVCSEEETDYKLLLYVISYWGVKTIPNKVLETFSKVERHEFTDYLLESMKEIFFKDFYKKFIIFSSVVNQENYCEVMAYHGYLDMLKWKLDSVDNKIHILNEAIRGGQLKIIKYLLEIGEKIDNENILSAIEYRKLDVLKYFLDNNLFEIRQTFFSHSLRYGSQEIIEFLYKEGYSLNYRTCYNMNFINLDGLKWLYSKRAFFIRQISKIIIERKFINAFKWIYEEGFRPGVLELDIINNSIEILNFLKSKNFVFSYDFFKAGLLVNDIKVIEFYLSLDFKLSKQYLEYYLDRVSNLDANIVLLFYQQRVQKSDDTVLKFAEKANYDNFKIILENNYTYDVDKILDLFSRKLKQTNNYTMDDIDKFQLFIEFSNTKINLHIMLIFLKNNSSLFEIYHSDFYQYDFYREFYIKYRYISYSVIDMIYNTFHIRPSKQFINDNDKNEDILLWLKKH